jgi:hypothetical protein
MCVTANLLLQSAILVPSLQTVQKSVCANLLLKAQQKASFFGACKVLKCCLQLKRSVCAPAKSGKWPLLLLKERALRKSESLVLPY